MKKTLVVFLLLTVLLVGCTHIKKSKSPTAPVEIGVNETLQQLEIGQGEVVDLALENTEIKLTLDKISEEVANVTIETQAGEIEVSISSKNDLTQIDLDGDGVPNLDLVKPVVENGKLILEVAKREELGDVSFPVTCAPGFKPGSSANIVFAIDESTSMDSPVELKNTDSINNTLAEKVNELQTKFLQMKNLFSQEELDTYLTSGLCAHVAGDKLNLCGEYTRLVEQVQAQLKQNPEAYKELSKIEVAKTVAASVIEKIEHLKNNANADVKIAIVPFSEVGYVAQELTGDMQTARETLNAIKTSPYTNIGDALKEAFAEIEKTRADKKIIILLSDGRPSRGMNSSELLKKYSQKARESNVAIYTIGFGIDEEEVDKNFLSTLANANNGDYSFASTGDELKNEFETFLELRKTLLESEGQINVPGEVEAGEFLVTPDAGFFEVELTQSGTVQAIAKVKHPIAEYTIKDKQLVPLPAVGKWTASVSTSQEGTVNWKLAVKAAYSKC